MNQVSILVDGFNLYHSLVDAEWKLQQCVKWLDIQSLISSYPQVIGGRPVFSNLDYFSAFANHRIPTDPDVTRRHQTYLDALGSTGSKVHLGRFKACKQTCKICRRSFDRYEEKETDVAIATGIIEACMDPDMNTQVLVSGDSDLAPALRMVRRRFLTKRIGIAFPYRRISEDLKRNCDFHWRLKPEQYLAHQFPFKIQLAGGRSANRPAPWM
ncbi:MAG: NYN domain-containing protein [Planctomycetes bacterium]|nr:NYN domain-containing protein [Planctomycetota bacterium]